MKHCKPKVNNQTIKIKTDDKELLDINKSIDWKKEREYLFTKIKTLEKEVNSLKTKNQELQIQLTLTQTSIESKKSFAVTDENMKDPLKRRVDHKRIYSEMFTSYRKKKLKQNSEDGRSGIGVLKQLIKQKPKSFGECTKEIIGNKILSNIIKEFRKDLKEKKFGQNTNNNNPNINNTINNNNMNRNLGKNVINKNMIKNNTINNYNSNTFNNNHNNVINKDNNKMQNQKIPSDNKFMKNLTTKINTYAYKKNNNNVINLNNNNINNSINKCFTKKNTNYNLRNDNNNNINNNNNPNNNIINNNNNCNNNIGNNKKNFNRRKIVCNTMNNTQNGSLADDSHQNGMNNKTFNQTRNDTPLNNELAGNYYGFYNTKRTAKNNIFNEIKNPLNNLNNNEIININNINNINNIDNDDFMEKINESSSGQTHHTGETILKKPNDFNSNINTSISNSLSNSTMKKSNSNNNNNTINNSNNSKNEQVLLNFNNMKNITPPISQSSSVIFQPYTKIDGFSSANSLSSKRSGSRNGPQSVLKFHLDAVRGIYIDPFQKVLTSISEDKTIALWDLEKILKHYKDEEPFLVFRIHTTPIFTIAGATNKKIIGDYLNNVSVYSSGSDGVIRGIKIPSTNVPNTEENLNKYTLLSWRVHQDMIWQLNYHPSNFLLSSVSSDGTVKIFKTYELYEENNIFEESKFRKSKMKKINLHHYYHYDNSYSKNLVRNFVFRNRRENIIEIPTSCDWRPEISSQIIVSHIAPYIKLYDIETGQNVSDFSFDIERGLQYESKQVNKIVFFNNDLFATGHEDKHVKFFDMNSKKIISDFVAHTDSVNDLCKGFNDNQLLTCSQDGSVRCWDLRGGKNKLIFDIPAHRKKYDEGCFSLKTLQYRGENYFVTCGADGCIKIFSS